VALAPVTATTGPVADAFVTTGPSDGPLGDWNYGGGGALAIAGADATRSGVTPAQRGTFESYLQFNVTQAQQTFNTAFGAGNWKVGSVSLQVTQTPPNNTIFNNQNSGTFSIDWIANDSWVEGTGTPMLPTMDGITYNTRPSGEVESEGTAFSYVNPSTTVTYTLGVGSLLATDIETDTFTSLHMYATDEADSTMSFTFNSRSFTTPSSRPVLTITAVLASLGDMNGDGSVNNFDISPFELALADPAAYEAEYSTITNWQDRGDINGDDVFNNFDISSFEQLLTTGSGSAPVPEPSSACLLLSGLAAAGVAWRAGGRGFCRPLAHVEFKRRNP
jgi:hypothetical protein